jgi:NAD(P)-dependent dehydrogenase (short-subunit alcohol dehydrogenase family)
LTLEGRGVLVVGGLSAHGRAAALLAAARGATVVFSLPPGAEARAAEIETLAHGRAVGVAADPTREDEVERLFAAAEARLPRLDVVVNAAPEPPSRRLLETSLADWEAGVALALRGAFFVSRLAVEEFLAHGAGGRLVHVAPVLRPGDPGQAMAAATLQALLSLMRSTAKEYGPRRVACNAVVPVVPVAADAAVHPQPPLTDAVAEAVLFLASAEASYLNGEALRASCPIA